MYEYISYSLCHRWVYSKLLTRMLRCLTEKKSRWENSQAWRSLNISYNSISKIKCCYVFSQRWRLQTNRKTLRKINTSFSLLSKNNFLKNIHFFYNNFIEQYLPFYAYIFCHISSAILVPPFHNYFIAFLIAPFSIHVFTVTF